MKKLMLSLAAAAIASSWAVHVQAQSADSKGVHDALVVFANAFNARDARAVAATFDDKGIMVNVYGVELAGRDAIEKTLGEAFAGPLKEASLKLTAETIRILSPNVAFQSDLFYVVGRKDAAGTEQASRMGHYLLIWAKRPGGWKVAALQTMIPAAR
ncbi:MAG: SgcJ/EcaC family oxidoreductase [Vicinamibacteria bacterium]